MSSIWGGFLSKNIDVPQNILKVSTFEEARNMKLIKIPFKIIAMPLIAFIRLICFVAKTAANISCYILGPIMFITFGIIIWMAIAQNWLSCIGLMVPLS